MALSRSIESVPTQLRAGFTLSVDSYSGPRGRGHLNAMILSAEVIGDIPVVGPRFARHAGTLLYVLGFCLLACAPDVGANRSACHSATDGGDILTASATYLVTENAANDGANNRTGNIGTATRLRNLFALDPAALSRCTQDRVDRGDARVVNALVAASAVVVSLNGSGCIAIVLYARV